MDSAVNTCSSLSARWHGNMMSNPKKCFLMFFIYSNPQIYMIVCRQLMTNAQPVNKRQPLSHSFPGRIRVPPLFYLTEIHVKTELVMYFVFETFRRQHIIFFCLFFL